MRLFKKILIITVLSILGLVLIATILVYAFEDDIKQYAVNRLNKNLNTQVHVDQIELSLWSNFPNATLEFTNVFIPDAYENRTSEDTFLIAGYLGMEFDIWDFYQGNYEVKQIQIRDGKVNIKVDDQGDGNYNIWKDSDEEVDDDEDFSFKLENLQAENMQLNYRNYHNGQDYSFYSKDLNLAGNFYESSFDLDVSSNMRINEFRSKSIRVVQDRNARLDLILGVNTDNNTYTISRGNLNIEKLKFDVTGIVKDDSANTYCDLAIDGEDINLADFFSSFAGDALSSFEEYESVGHLSFQSTVKGNIGPTENPLVKASFTVQNGSVKQISTGIEIEQMNLNGSYTNNGNNGKEELRLTDLSGVFLNKPFDGEFHLTDFATPKISILAKGTMDLAAVKSFFNISDLQHVSGIATFNTDLSFTIKNPQNPELRNVDVHKSRGRIDFQGISFKLADYPHLYEEVKGAFFLRGEDAAVRELSMRTGKSQVVLDGAFQNFLSHILKGQKRLNIIANLESPFIDLNDLMIPASEGKDESKESPYELPSTMNFNLDAEIGELHYGSLLAKRISGNFMLLDKVLRGDHVTMQTCGGTVAGSFELDGTQKNVFLSSFKGRIKGMNVDQAMVNFERFGQTMFTEKNLKGEIDATFEVAALLDGNFNFDMNSITAMADVTIENGELIQLSALTEITEYMREKKSVDLLFSRHINELEKRLHHVKFSKMENRIHIKESKVSIPEMEIRSNVMDMNLSGTHTFDNAINYTMNFRFRDLLSKKDEYTEFGKIVDDGTGLRLFLRMTGTVDDPIIAIDREEKRTTIKEDLKEEGETMKSILKKDLGLYKNDTTVKEYESTPQEEVEFLIYEGDEDQPTYEEEQKNWEERKDSLRESRRNKSRIGKFINKLKEEKEKEEGDVQFEIEK